MIDSDKLITAEKRISKKVADSVDSLGGLIKEYALKQKRINDRVNELEQRIDGKDFKPKQFS